MSNNVYKNLSHTQERGTILSTSPHPKFKASLLKRATADTKFYIDELKSRKVRIGNGMMQGSAHGPLCFNIYYETVIRLFNRCQSDKDAY